MSRHGVKITRHFIRLRCLRVRLGVPQILLLVVRCIFILRVTPLNKSAVDGLKLSRLTANVPYNVKEGADLNEAVQIGLKVCYEQEDKLASYSG